MMPTNCVSGWVPGAYGVAHEPHHAGLSCPGSPLGIAINLSAWQGLGDCQPSHRCIQSRSFFFWTQRILNKGSNWTQKKMNVYANYKFQEKTACVSGKQFLSAIFIGLFRCKFSD